MICSNNMPLNVKHLILSVNYSMGENMIYMKVMTCTCNVNHLTLLVNCETYVIT